MTRTTVLVAILSTMTLSGSLASAQTAEPRPLDLRAEARKGAAAHAKARQLRQPAAAAAVDGGPAPAASAATVQPAALAAAGEDAAAGSALPRRAAVASASSAAAGYRALIAKHAAENGIPFNLADAIVRIESRYNARAKSGPNIGLTQINGHTARSLGYSGDAGGLYDPDTNLRYGIRYLAQAYRLAGGETCGTVLRYQAGHRATSMTRAARVYCAKVKTHLASSR